MMVMGDVSGIRTVLVEWNKDDTGRWKMSEVPGTFVNHIVRYILRTKIQFCL